MIVRLTAFTVAAAMTVVGAAPQSAAPIRIYVAEPSSSASGRDYAVDIDGTIVPATTLTRGPHPLSVIVLQDVSDSIRPIRPGPLEALTRRLAGRVRPGDTVRLATFADRTLVGSTPIIDRASATQAAREVTQAGGASPLWDAICVSVDALRTADDLRAVVVFSDGQATANDRGIDETYEVATRSGVIISVVGLTDDASMVSTQIRVVGRNDALRRLARDTGGRYSELRTRRDDHSSAVVSAVNDLRGRARLEFVPPVRDGAIHRVSVTLGGAVVHGPVWMQF